MGFIGLPNHMRVSIKSTRDATGCPHLIVMQDDVQRGNLAISA
jgi:hypothetical protein